MLQHTHSPRSAAPRPARSSGGAPTDMRMAAIDVGSNSIHMAIAQIDADGSVTTLWRLKEMVGLGRISFPSKRLSAEAMERAMTTLRRFQAETRRRQCEKVIAVATSAVREAENGGDFVSQVRKELRVPLRVVSARDEAKLIYLGVRHAMDWEALDGPVLIVDIGGGSVEFIVADAGPRPAILESLKLGAARMSAHFVKSDPISQRDLDALLNHFDAELGPLCQRIAALRPRYAIGTSGTFENLSTLCGGSAIAPADDTTAKLIESGAYGWIDRDALGKLCDRLIASTSADRAKIAGLDEKRQDQITAGALLARELFQRLSLRQMAVCRSAMREGMLAEYASRHLPDLTVRRTVPDPRRRSVLDLARRCDWHKEHSEHVAELALQLFDGLCSLHGLKSRPRELIEYGSLLHDIGWHIQGEGHHKHSMYLIRHGGLKGFKPEEVRIIANIARYHRKSPPSLKHKPYRALSAKARKIVRLGAALLRVADALDRTHCGAVRRIQLVKRKGNIRLRLLSRGDIELELWAARSKSELLKEVLECDVTFERAE